MDNQTEEIKQRVDIVDFIGQYVQLKITGINHKGLCPFHNEKTPSFMVNSERQIYKCFGCNEGGDIFDFVQKIEGLDFYDSLKLLADRAGVTLKARNPEKAREAKESKTQLLDLNKTLAELYHQLLLTHKAGADARSYIKKRKITESTIKNFQIGYAPNNIARVKDYLGKMGFSESELARAGNPERFRNRLMFPIADTIGSVVGFSGRALEKDQEPKYLNTRETPVFYKSKVLYGFDLSKKTIRETGTAIIVEGQMDVVSSHQAGVCNAVATSGTALTEQHLLLIRRQTHKVAFAFDADDAGFNTTLKSLAMAWQLSMEPYIIEMPEGCKDAGDTVEKDPKLWIRVSKKVVPAYDWLWKVLSNKYQLGTTEGKKEIARAVVPIVAAVAEPVERDDYIRRLSKDLNISENALLDSIKKISSGDRRSSASGDNSRLQSVSQNAKDGSSATGNEWIDLLALLNIVPAKIPEARDLLEGKMGSGTLAQVYEKVFAWYNKDKSGRAPDFLAVLPTEFSKKIKEQIVVIESQNLNIEDYEKDINSRLQKLGNRWREKIKENFAQKIAEAEKDGDIKKVQKLMQELQQKI